MITAHFEFIYGRLIEALGKARHSVQLCVAWMNPELFGNVIDDLLERGVRVDIAYYNVPANHRLRLHFHGRPVNLYRVRPRWYGAYMHHKFCIIDDAVLITGSYNWTKNAARGFENVIIAENEFQLVKQYKHEFEDITSFVEGEAARGRKRCFDPRCQSEAYHLAVFYPNDPYAPMATGIWQVCERYRHAKLIRREPYTADDEFEVEPYDTDASFQRAETVEDIKQNMLREFAAERESFRFIKSKNAQRFGVPIDAYGSVREKDEALNSKGGGGYSYPFPEREIAVQWRDVYYRKTIPEVLSEDEGYRHIIHGRDCAL